MNRGRSAALSAFLMHIFEAR
eukprot:COSAG04_NODE_1505_length_6506_cov_4.798335_1_plen_20_part_10